MNSLQVKKENSGGKGEILVFSSIKYNKAKKLVSALIALIFLFNNIAPVYAQRERDGNFGPHGSLYNFGMGALAGAATSIGIVINPIAGTVSSITSDLSGLAMYRYMYSTQGEPMKIFGWETPFSKGEFYSMVIGIVVGMGAGLIEGAASAGVEAGSGAGVGGATPELITEGTNQAKDGTTPTLSNPGKTTFETIVLSVVGAVTSALPSFLQNAINAAVKAIIKAISWIIKNIIKPIVDRVINFFRNLWGFITHPRATMQKLMNSGKAANKYAGYVTKDAAGHIAVRVDMVLVNLAADIIIGTLRLTVSKAIAEKLKKQGMDETLAELAAGAITDNIVGPIASVIILRAFAAPFGWSATADGGFMDAKTAEAINRLYELGNEVGRLAEKDGRVREYLSLSERNLGKLSAEDIAKKKALEAELASQDPQVAAKVREFIAARNNLANAIQQSVQLDDYTRLVAKEKRGEALSKKEKAEKLQLERSLPEEARQTANQYFASREGLPQEARHALNEYSQPKEKQGSDDSQSPAISVKEYTELSLRENDIARRGQIRGEIGEERDTVDQYIDKHKEVSAIRRYNEVDHIRDIQGENLNQRFKWYDPRAGFEYMRSLGIAPLASAATKILILKALGYKTYYGNSDRGRIYENLWKTALADAGANVAGSVTNNLDFLGRLYAGTSNNPWQSRGDAKSWVSPRYLGRLIIGESAKAAGQIGWGAIARNNRIDSDVVGEFGHLAANTLATGLIDVIFRRDPGIRVATEATFSDGKDSYDRTELMTYYPPEYWKKVRVSEKEFKFVSRTGKEESGILTQTSEDTFDEIGRGKINPWAAAVEMNNRFINASASVFPDVNPALRMGPGALQADWQRTDTYTQHIGAMMRGASPKQALAMRLASAMNAQGSAMISEATSAAFSPLWLGFGKDYDALTRKLKYGTYVRFDTGFTTVKEDIERIKSEAETRQNRKQDLESVSEDTLALLSLSRQKDDQIKELGEKETKLQEQKDKLYKERVGSLSSQADAQASTPDMEQVQHYVNLALLALVENLSDKQKQELTAIRQSLSSDILGRLDGYVQEAGGIDVEIDNINQQMHPIVTERNNLQDNLERVATISLPYMSAMIDDGIIRSWQAGNLTSDQEENFYREIANNQPAVIAAIEKELSTKEKTRAGMEKTLPSYLGYIPLMGGVLQAVLGLSRANALGREVLLSDVATGGYGTIYSNDGIAKSPSDWSLDDALRVKLSSIVGKSKEEQETAIEDLYAQPNLSVEQLSAVGTFAYIITELSGKDREQAIQALLRGRSRGRQGNETVVYAGNAAPSRSYGTPAIADVQMDVLSQKIRQELGYGDEEISPEQVRKLQATMDFLPQGEENVAKAQTIIEALKKGIQVYSPTAGLLSYTTVDNYGRQLETLEYGQEYRFGADGTDGAWEQIQLNKSSTYYHGPFGLERIEERDYTQMKPPTNWPTRSKPVTETKSEPTQQEVEDKTKPIYGPPAPKQEKAQEPESAGRSYLFPWETTYVDWSGIGYKIKEQDLIALQQEISGAAPSQQVAQTEPQLVMPDLSDTGLDKWLLPDTTAPDTNDRAVRIRDDIHVANSGPGRTTWDRVEFPAPSTAAQGQSSQGAQEIVPQREIVGYEKKTVPGEPKTTQVTKEITEDAPLSIGPNITQDLYIYSIGKGSSPYVNPNYRVISAEINSGPYRQPAAHYTTYSAREEFNTRVRAFINKKLELDAVLSEGLTDKERREAYKDQLSKEIAGLTEYVRQEDIDSWLLKGETELVDFAAELFGMPEERSQILAQGDIGNATPHIKEAWKHLSDKRKEVDTELNGGDISSPEYLKKLKDEIAALEEYGISPEIIYERLRKSSREFEGIVAGLPANKTDLLSRWAMDDFRSDELDKQLEKKNREILDLSSQDLAQIKELHFFKYDELEYKDHMRPTWLPLWGWKAGYDIDRNYNLVKHFERSQANMYTKEEIEKAKQSAKDRWLNMNNTDGADRLDEMGLHRFKDKDTDIILVTEDPLDEYLSAMYGYATEISDTKRKYETGQDIIPMQRGGIGADPIIPVIDVLKGDLDVQPVSLDISNPPAPNIQWIYELEPITVEADRVPITPPAESRPRIPATITPSEPEDVGPVAPPVEQPEIVPPPASVKELRAPQNIDEQKTPRGTPHFTPPAQPPSPVTGDKTTPAKAESEGITFGIRPPDLTKPFEGSGKLGLKVDLTKPLDNSGKLGIKEYQLVTPKPPAKNIELEVKMRMIEFEKTLPQKPTAPVQPPTKAPAPTPTPAPVNKEPQAQTPPPVQAPPSAQTLPERRTVGDLRVGDTLDMMGGDATITAIRKIVEFETALGADGGFKVRTALTDEEKRIRDDQREGVLHITLDQKGRTITLDFAGSHFLDELGARVIGQSQAPSPAQPPSPVTGDKTTPAKAESEGITFGIRPPDLTKPLDGSGKLGVKFDLTKPLDNSGKLGIKEYQLVAPKPPAKNIELEAKMRMIEFEKTLPQKTTEPQKPTELFQQPPVKTPASNQTPPLAPAKSVEQSADQKIKDMRKLPESANAFAPYLPEGLPIKEWFDPNTNPEGVINTTIFFQEKLKKDIWERELRVRENNGIRVIKRTEDYDLLEGRINGKTFRIYARVLEGANATPGQGMFDDFSDEDMQIIVYNGHGMYNSRYSPESIENAPETNGKKLVVLAACFTGKLLQPMLDKYGSDVQLVSIDREGDSGMSATAFGEILEGIANAENWQQIRQNIRASLPAYYANDIILPDDSKVLRYTDLNDNGQIDITEVGKNSQEPPAFTNLLSPEQLSSFPDIGQKTARLQTAIDEALWWDKAANVYAHKVTFAGWFNGQEGDGAVKVSRTKNAIKIAVNANLLNGDIDGTALDVLYNVGQTLYPNDPVFGQYKGLQLVTDYVGSFMPFGFADFRERHNIPAEIYYGALAKSRKGDQTAANQVLQILRNYNHNQGSARDIASVSQGNNTAAPQGLQNLDQQRTPSTGAVEGTPNLVGINTGNASSLRPHSNNGTPVHQQMYETNNELLDRAVVEADELYANGRYEDAFNLYQTASKMAPDDFGISKSLQDVRQKLEESKGIQALKSGIKDSKLPELEVAPLRAPVPATFIPSAAATRPLAQRERNFEWLDEVGNVAPVQVKEVGLATPDSKAYSLGIKPPGLTKPLDASDRLGIKEFDLTSIEPKKSPGFLRQAVAATAGNLPLVGKYFDLSEGQARTYAAEHDGKVPYLLRPWGTNQFGWTLFGDNKFRKTLGYATLGLHPLNDRQAAEYKEENKVDALSYFLRPWFSSELGLSPLNKGADHGFTLSGFLTNDILHPWADKEAIIKLNKGLNKYTSPDERRQYIKDHYKEYKKAGAISIFAGGGKGEIITDKKTINNPSSWEGLYYLGNLRDKDQSVTYAGQRDDILLTLPLHPENYTTLNSIADAVKPINEDAVKPWTDGYGTAALIAKAGPQKIYLTAEHCLPVNGSEVINVSNNSDLGIFSVNNSSERANTGESISIVPIYNTDLEKGDRLDFYARALAVYKGQFTKPEMRQGEVVDVDTKKVLYGSAGGKGTVYESSIRSTKGHSGSPVFKETDQGIISITGILSGGDGFLHRPTYFVKPGLIREFIANSRKPSLKIDQDK